MKRIGVRELRQNASEHLRLVQLGETIEITDRGRPVALLVPVQEKEQSRVEALHRQGRLSADLGDLLDLGAPLKPVAGVPCVSDELERSRQAER